jgi:geranylgeranyl diphosphate synthase type II
MPANGNAGASNNAAHFDLPGYLANRRTQINTALEKLLKPNNNSATELSAAMHYAIAAGGKRLRPILCMAAAHAVGGLESQTLPAGCALEMIHTYSLIHDDLPAMDDDDLRRGHPTCHKAFGEATAILAGDALLTGAFELLSKHALRQPKGEQGRWLNIIAAIAVAAGRDGMIEGQMRDIEAEGRALDLQQLEQLHRKKTGALISAAINTGAVIGRATDEMTERLQEYGRCIGLAFQVTDDILNEEGDPLLMGKAVGTDRQHQKNTYPGLLGLKDAKQKALDLVGQALRSLDNFDNKSDPLRAVARYIIERRR